MELVPGSPDVGAEACSGLLAVADDGGLHEGGVVKNLVLLGHLVVHVLHQSDIRVLGIPVDEIVDAAYGPEHAVELLAGHAEAVQVDGLKFDPPLFKPALRFLGVEALGFSKNLNIQ